MPSPVEETIPPGMQSLSDAVARVVNVSERSVVTSVEQETTSEHELVLKANTAEDSNKNPATCASSTGAVDTSDDRNETATLSAATKQTTKMAEANANEKAAKAKANEKTVDTTVFGVSTTAPANPSDDSRPTETTQPPTTATAISKPVATTDVTQATAPSTAATKQTLVTSEANVTEKSVDRTVVGLSSTVSAITTEVTPPAHAGEMGITAPPTPSTANPTTKVTGVETEVPPVPVVTEPLPIATLPSKVVTKEKLIVKLIRPRPQAKLPQRRKKVISEANIAAISQSVSVATRSKTNDDVSTRTRQASSTSSPTGSPKKKRKGSSPSPKTKKAKIASTPPPKKKSPKTRSEKQQTQVGTKTQSRREPIRSTPPRRVKPATETTKAPLLREPIVSKSKLNVKTATGPLGGPPPRESILSTPPRKPSPTKKGIGKVPASVPTTKSPREPIVPVAPQKKKVTPTKQVKAKSPSKREPIVSSPKKKGKAREPIVVGGSPKVLASPLAPQKKKVTPTKQGKAKSPSKREPIVVPSKKKGKAREPIVVSGSSKVPAREVAKSTSQETNSPVDDLGSLSDPLSDSKPHAKPPPDPTVASKKTKQGKSKSPSKREPIVSPPKKKGKATEPIVKTPSSSSSDAVDPDTVWATPKTYDELRAARGIKTPSPNVSDGYVSETVITAQEKSLADVMLELEKGVNKEVKISELTNVPTTVEPGKGITDVSEDILDEVKTTEVHTVTQGDPITQTAPEMGKFKSTVEETVVMQVVTQGDPVTQTVAEMGDVKGRVEETAVTQLVTQGEGTGDPGNAHHGDNEDSSVGVIELGVDEERLSTPPWMTTPILEQRAIPNDPLPQDTSGSLILKATYAVHVAYKTIFPSSNTLMSPFMEFIARTNTDDETLDEAVSSTDMLRGSFFTGLPIAWFVDMMQSTDLNLKLGGKRIPLSKFKRDKVSLFTKLLPERSNYRFWVIHNNGRKSKSMLSASITKHKQLTNSFRRFETQLVNFFKRQFDVLHKDKIEAITRGLASDCDTIFVLGFDNGNHYNIIAAVQYVPTCDGVYINWLGVEHKFGANVSFTQKGKGEKLIQFRKLGIGTFLLNLVQMQQIGRGFKHTLILQTNPTSRARTFYQNRGFVQSQPGGLQSIPHITETSFRDWDTHFVDEQSQREDGTETENILVLLYQEACLFTKLHDGVVVKVDETLESAENLLFPFPFDCEGSYLEKVVIPNEDWLFAHPAFKASSGMLYALRNHTDPADSKVLFREEGMYDGACDDAPIELQDLNSLKEEQPLMGIHVDLWACWLLRHMEGDVANDVLIVPLLVSASISACMELLEGDYQNLGKPVVLEKLTQYLSMVDKYLWGHPDLFEKRLILITTSSEPDQWTGYALLNPWVCLVKATRSSNKLNDCGNMKKKKFDIDTCLSGMICNNTNALTESPSSDVIVPLWFLNLASHYRDLRLHDKHTLFNLEAMVGKGIPVWYYLFLGFTGPFANLHNFEDNQENNYPLLEEVTSRIGIKHPNGALGSEVWCLFMYDAILSINKRALITTEDNTIQFGSHTHTHAYLQVKDLSDTMTQSEYSVVFYLCMLLRGEMRLVVERLRYVYLQATTHPQTQFSFPPEWGVPGKTTLLNQMTTNVNFQNAVKPVLDASKKARNKPEPMYRLEKQFRANINDRSKYDPLELSDYILESPVFAKEFVNDRLVKGDSDFGDNYKMKGLDFIIDLMKEESNQTRRWKTMVYDHPDPPPGKPTHTKKPAGPEAPAGAKAQTTNALRDIKAARPPTPDPPLIPPKKRRAKRKNILGPLPPPLLEPRERRATDRYQPDAQSPGFNRSTKHKDVKRRRTTRLDDPWGYLPITLSKRLEKDVMADKGGTYVEKAKNYLLNEPPFKTTLIGLKDESLHPMPKDLLACQENFDEAKIRVDDALNLPATNEEVASIRAAIEDPRERVMYDKWITSAVSNANLEASILMYDSITDIAWLPSGPRHVNRLVPLKGQYYIRVRVEETGELVDCEATSDWMELNYPKDILASIQRAAYQKLERVETSDTKDEKLLTGFIEVEGEGPNFVKVEGVCVGVKLDGDVINRLKYVKGKKVNVGPIYDKDEDGAMLLDEKGCAIPVERQKKIIPAKWYGYSNETKKLKELVTSWVTNNFDKRLLSQIKSISNKKAAFISIPPGADKKHNDETSKEHAIGPPIKYQQLTGERTCMVYGMASAVHHAGGKQVASEIRNLAKRFEHNSNAFETFLLALRSKHKAFIFKKEKTTTYDILKLQPNELVLACLRGGDGMEDHCIAVYDRWIFDSNFPRALALTNTSLDLCCSSNEVNSVYKGCTQVVSFPNIYMAK